MIYSVVLMFPNYNLCLLVSLQKFYNLCLLVSLQFVEDIIFTNNGFELKTNYAF